MAISESWDQNRTIRCQGADEALLHELNKHWRETRLYYVSTNAPNDRLAHFSSASHSGRQRAQLLHR
jgi:hypothetical protein